MQERTMRFKLNCAKRSGHQRSDLCDSLLLAIHKVVPLSQCTPEHDGVSQPDDRCFTLTERGAPAGERTVDLSHYEVTQVDARHREASSQRTNPYGLVYSSANCHSSGATGITS